MKKTAAILLLIITTLSALSGDTEAVLQSLSGKVEVKSLSGSWEPGSPGMIIKKGDTLSTGFKAEALLKIGDSLLQVKQLTRMTLEELIEKEGTIKTDLYLNFGSIKADIKSSSGLKNSYKLSSPIATAAVRGTVFTFDGVNLEVEEGTVILYNRLNQGRSVSGGETSQASEERMPLTTEKDPAREETGEESPVIPDIPVSTITGTDPAAPNPETELTVTPVWPGDSITNFKREE